MRALIIAAVLAALAAMWRALRGAQLEVELLRQQVADLEDANDRTTQLPLRLLGALTHAMAQRDNARVEVRALRRNVHRLLREPDDRP